jgi:hypothetical protein
MPQQCFKPFRAQSIRVTELTDCCTPPDPSDISPASPGESPAASPCSIAVTDAFTLVSAEAEVDEGEDILERKANGDICINERDPDVLTGMNLSITLCQVTPWFISKLTGWPVVMDQDCNAVGFDIMEGINLTQSAVELWSGVSGLDCGAGARYGYSVAPCVENWQLDGAIEFGGSDTIWSITLTGFAKGNHPWGRGPYNDVQMSSDGRLVDPMQNGAIMRLMATDVPPPAYIGACVDCLPPTAEFGYVGLSAESPVDPCLIPA